MKLKIESKPFDGYMSPAVNLPTADDFGGCCCHCNCCCCASVLF